MLDEILEYNKSFVSNKEYIQYTATKFPNKQIAVVSCMDTRLVELLPAAMGFKNGDVKLIKNAGGVISHPYGSVIRSILIGVYELGIKEILVVGHTDCGARCTHGEEIIKKMKNRGITENNISKVYNNGIDIIKWLNGFYDLEKSIQNSVSIIKSHDLVPSDINVYGLVINSKTGELSKVC